MKILLILIIIVTYPDFVYLQNVKYINFEGIQRRYLEYLPNSNQLNNPMPLVICLHGLGDNIENFKNIGMHLVGDTAKFITIYPEAVGSIIGAAWNSGVSYLGYVLNSNINDVGFLLKLIDTLKSQFSIDTTRIYVCGYSMGGFMANRMACEAANKITAIASVAGTIGNSLSCNPANPIPICHFHGTEDQVVSYTNNIYGMNVDDMISFWRNVNDCDSSYLLYNFPNVANDNIVVESYFYPSQNSNDVVLIKAIGAQHQWLFMPLNDISYTFEIWHFFRKYKISNSYHKPLSENYLKSIIYPNPVNKLLYISTEYLDGIKEIKIFDINGICIYRSNVNNKQLDVSFLKSGLYNFQLVYQNKIIYQKLLIIP